MATEEYQRTKKNKEEREDDIFTKVNSGYNARRQYEDEMRELSDVIFEKAETFRRAVFDSNLELSERIRYNGTIKDVQLKLGRANPMEIPDLAKQLATALEEFQLEKKMKSEKKRKEETKKTQEEKAVREMIEKFRGKREVYPLREERVKKIRGVIYNEY